MRPQLNATPAESPSHVGADAPYETGPRHLVIAYETLDDAALLTLIVRRSVRPRGLAADLLARFGALGDIAAADPAELARVRGMAPEVISDLKLLRELTVRLARIEASHRPVIASWGALTAYVRVALAHRPREQFRALYLDNRNTLLRDELVADGTIDHAPVYPREVVRRALELSAAAFILVHNHPSGDPAPSHADIEMTRQIVEAAKVFGLRVHDHIVVGRNGTASFKALGLI